MGRGFLSSLGETALAIRNKAPVPYVAGGRSRGLMLPSMSPAGMEAQMRAAGSVGTLFAIVDRIITAYSQVEWHLYKSAKSGRKEDREEVTDHPALALWQSPNPFMTGPAFRETTQQHEELTGEQWWVIVPHERLNMPGELWPVRPDRMEPVPDAKEYLLRYDYRAPGGGVIELDLKHVVFLRRPNPLDLYRGMGAVQTILADLEGSRLAAEWVRNFFYNSAQPGGVIEVDRNLTEPQWDEFQARWAESHRGVSNAHRVAMLENGMKWVDRRFTMQELQLTDLRKASGEMIREAFGFPRPMLGTVDDTNRANMEAADTMMARWLSAPRLERAKQAFNTQVLPLYGPLGRGYELDYDNPVPADEKKDAEVLIARARSVRELVQAGASLAGALSAVGLPEIEPAVVAPGGLAGSGPEAVAAIARVAESLRGSVGSVLTSGEVRRLLARAGVELDAAAVWPPRERVEAVRLSVAPRAIAAAGGGDDGDPVRRQFEAALESLLAEWERVEGGWVEALADAVETAVDDGDAGALGALSVDTTAGASVLRQALTDMAEAAAERMVAEAAEQGVEVDTPKLEVSNRVSVTGIRAAYGSELVDVAVVTAALLGADLARSAAVEALRLFTPGAAGRKVADGVKSFLRGLKGRFKKDQLGGALHRAQNTGRIAVLEEAPTARYFATEKNDSNRCLAPEVLVTTRSGPVPAKDVTLDDELLTHSGHWVKPDRIVVSEVEEQLTRVLLADGRSLRLTWDHPVLVRSGDGFAWRNAGDLTVGDFIVDQSTLERGGEVGAVDLSLGQAPDDVSPVGDVGSLASVDVGAQGVPVVPVGLDDERVADEEVHDPRAYLGLGSVGTQEVFEGLADSAFEVGLGVAGSVAADGTVTAAGGDRWNDAEVCSAVVAGDDDGRPTAGLGAVASLVDLGVAEGGAAPLAGGGDASGVAAFLRAADVPVGGAGGDAELLAAFGADLGHAPRGVADLGDEFRVGELALRRAVDGAGPVPGRDLSAAHLAERRREVRVLAQPRSLARAPLAERADLDRGTARHTHLVHDLSVQVATVQIASIEGELHVGEVFDFTIPEDETFWAEGVLVHNCTPCSEIDGTEFDDLDAVRAAYGTGGYLRCEGGIRCRGTVTALWE